MPRTARTAARRSATVRPSAPLGSLIQRSAAEMVHCAACASTRVTQISMRLTDGSAATLTSCHVCEHRSWATPDGGVLPVTTVLDRARKVG